jgi:hypothetical protein
MPRQCREETAQRWASRLAQFETSTLSVAQFCQSIDCSIGSFYLWKRKLAKQLQPPPLSFVYKPRFPLQQVSKSNSRRGSQSAYR